MKNIYLITTTTLLLSGCGSIQPYQEPAPDQGSATLTIAFRNEIGVSSLSYGRADEDGCMEFPSLHSAGSVHFKPKRLKPAPKDVRIPANGPQILQYSWVTSYSSGSPVCTFTLRFEPKNGGHYLVTNDNSIQSEKRKALLFGDNTVYTEKCMVYVQELDENKGMKPVSIKPIAVAPTRLGYPGCPRVVK